MQPYTGFASVYDMFMDNVPYEEWAEYICDLLRRHQINSGLVLELGCGTGNLTRQLAAKGYDMIGVDNSEEMLSIARDKSENSDDSILYLCQDMREFELYGTVSAAISVCDSMNYILTEEDLLKVFRLVNNYLDPKGIFIFDLDTQYAYQEVLGDHTIAENREEGSFIWENTYYEQEMINEVNLTLFIPEQDDSFQSAKMNNDNAGLFRRYEETHYRRAYTIDTMKRLIEEAGMEWITVYDAYTVEEPKEDSERVYIIAREKWQADKLYVNKE
ncbi:class I SAM-dependent methyltransferase [Lachnospiraceae bacterium MD1]|jgi:SAM-dependent methyltransferase|uniref:Class I SAM-dependent methyltransferase n=1 Tax=Variimorphobacter saccharofermentans TaxID=2755051 RepID=A0A839JXD6_9FIRM|nr:class I SAM-dependent methyltransferase [Variimorphobacter saccharofermentans]MBB2182066.1 class I SAM-dependent methyltransferase [Variimorphobacter saccharofermentans]